MDSIKKLTGKNPSEYEPIAKSIIDNSDIELFSKLVGQDDFLFDFIKNNVAKRLQQACNSTNYRNILPLLKCYSPSYDMMFGEVLNSFGGEDIYPEMKKLFMEGSAEEKAYAAKYLTFRGNFDDLLPVIRKYAKSDYEPLSVNSIELLSMINDDVLKNEAIEKLSSNDEFEQYDAVKFLVTYGAKDCLDRIVEVMKKSGLSESIASELLYLISIDEFMNIDKEAAILVLCNVINAIPEIVSLSIINDIGLYNVFEKLLSEPMTSSSALLFAIAKDKFEEFSINEEYMYDSDKNTKDCVKGICDLLKNLNKDKLKSYIYDELYDESDFVFFALDYADDVEELETLLDSKNQTLVMKVLTVLKERGILQNSHKQMALETVNAPELKQFIEVL